eukprot:COSAG02_NODE_37632_length_439_cov_1.017647_1_plen_63_part_10
MHGMWHLDLSYTLPMAVGLLILHTATSHPQPPAAGIVYSSTPGGIPASDPVRGPDQSSPNPEQ